MASGWWSTTHANLAEVSPADFAVTTSLSAPRGYPKLASIATGAGHYLGGSPSVVSDGVLYYAGDDYTQDTDNPPLMRYDGRIGSTVVEIPPVGVTPSKAILSVTADPDRRLFISTWDSGTSSSDFAGRVFILSTDGTLTRIDAGLFTGGKLPLSLAWFDGALYVGVAEAGDAVVTEVVKLPVDGALPGGPTPTPTLTGTTYTYQVGGFNTNPTTGSYIGRSDHTNVINRASLNASVYHDLSWNNPIGAQSWRLERETAPSVGTIAQVIEPNPRTHRDVGAGVIGGVPPDDGIPQNITLTIVPTPAEETYTYRIGAIVNGIEFISTAVNVTARTSLFADLYVAITWSAHTDATSYRVYRTAGGASQGLIATTADLSFNDTGIASTGSVPELTSSITVSVGGGVAALVPYNDNLYAAVYAPTGTAGRVVQIDDAGVATLSVAGTPADPTDGNGFTAGFVYNDKLYMSYWVDDPTTDQSIIYEYDDSSWNVRNTINGAGARAFVAFCEADGVAYAYGGGDAKTGILYESADGVTWTDVSALLPSSKEAIPFMADISVLGGF